jgi:TAT (twin-arginine translocation) pathway signal sequence
MLETKVSRRDMLKAGGVLVVGAAAAPYLAKSIPSSGGLGKGAPTQSGSASTASGANASGSGGGSANEPLVLMVKGEEVTVFQGKSETKFVDGKLSGTLMAKFGASSGSSTWSL